MGLWNYCSIENKYFEQFAFDLYDKDSSGTIDVSEAQFMLKDIYGEDFERSPRAKKVYQKLAELEISEINFPVFMEFTQKHKAMLYPAFALQLSLKKYIMGTAFWKKQAAARLMLCRGQYQTIEEIIGEELIEKQKGTSGLKKNHGSAPAGRRGSKSKHHDVTPPDSGRRGSHESQHEQVKQLGRRGSKDGHHVQGMISRKGSKVLEFEIMNDPRGQALYQKFISGHHQDKNKKVQPEIRRHSRSSAVHPIAHMTHHHAQTISISGDMTSVVKMVTMQQHVKDNLKMTTKLLNKNATHQVHPRRNTHH